MIIYSIISFKTIFLLLVLGKACNFKKIADDSSCPQLSPQCTCDVDTITCSNFTSFSELNLSNYNTTKIFLSPLNLAILDKNFNLDNLIYPNPNDISIDLINVQGFDLRSGFFKKQSIQDVQLSFQDSKFAVYIDDVLLAPENCNWNLIDQNYVSLFNNVSRLVLESVDFVNEICPIVFKNVNIDVLYTEIVSNQNHLSFSNLADQNGQILNSNVNNYFIVGGDFYLDATFMSTQIFQNLKEIIVTNSKLRGIDDKLFSKIKKIEKIALGINNFGDFYKSGTKWLNSINDDLYVDLNNQTEININANRQVMLYRFLLKYLGLKLLKIFIVLRRLKYLCKTQSMTHLSTLMMIFVYLKIFLIIA
jgi:hypothetical protein